MLGVCTTGTADEAPLIVRDFVEERLDVYIIHINHKTDSY